MRVVSGDDGVEKIRTFPFSSDSNYDSVTYDLVISKMSESKAEAVKDRPITMLIHSHVL